MLTRDARFVRFISLVSFSFAALLCLVLARSVPGASMPMAFFLVAALTAWHAIPRLQHSPKALNWVLGFSIVNLLIICPELALRVRDFRYEAGIQFGYPRPSRFMYLQPDDQLFWRRSRADRNVNSLGFVGSEVRMQKPHGVVRVIFFGDSVTEQGIPDVVQHLLNVAHAQDSTRFECVSLATAGYSSYQGRVLVDLYGAPLEPDAAVVLFGWNDHYRAYGAPDAQKAAVKVEHRPTPRLLERLRHSLRILQACTWASDKARGKMPQPLEELRVPAPDYEANLTYIGDRFRSADVPVVFLTAPTSHYRLQTPDYLVERDFATDKASSLALHRQYNDIVRRVAQTQGAVLLDLERELSALPPRELGALFSRDGIHLTLAGIAVASTRVAEALASLPPR